MDSFTLYSMTPDRVAIEIELEAAAIRSQIEDHRANHCAVHRAFIRECFAFATWIIMIFGLAGLLFTI